MLSVEVYSIYCNVLNGGFFERRADITQSTIYLSILYARSCPTPECTAGLLVKVKFGVKGWI